jgi:hypothetical protein
LFKYYDFLASFNAGLGQITLDLKRKKVRAFLEQMKQRGSAPHLPIRSHRPHPSDH